MPTLVEALPDIAGAYVIRYHLFTDARGWGIESYRQTWFPHGRPMAQGNCSHSRAGVLRGMHYHERQADLWMVPQGHVQAALYDLRQGSPTEGSSFTVDLVPGDLGLYIPPGVAHGFAALTDSVLVYLVDELYDGTDEHGVLWSDPVMALPWKLSSPTLSARDANNPTVTELESLPRWRAGSVR